MNLSNVSIFSLFSGIGFLDLGFEMQGGKVVFMNEIDPAFVEGYKFARKQLGIEAPQFGYHRGDINELLSSKASEFAKMVKKAKMENDFVGFIGGPPCPDFSVGGKNRGIKGENGKLSQSYADLICEVKPDFFLFENVKGLWRTAKHREFFEKLKKQFKKSGYVLTEHLINAIEYGAPQDRERIILLGFKKDLVKKSGYDFNKTNLFLPEESFSWANAVQYKRDEVFSMNWPQRTEYKENKNIPTPKKIIAELTVEHWFRKNAVDTHPNAGHFFQPRAALPRFKVIDEGDDSKKSFKRLHRWRYSPTACYGNNEVHLHPYKSRRITVAEALAIQSLPAKFALPDEMSLTDMFKSIGNGVPFLASKSLAAALGGFLAKK